MLLASHGLLAQREGQKPYMVKTFKAADIKNIEANTSGGSIWVQSTSAAETTVEVYVNLNNGKSTDTEEIERRLDNYVFKFSQVNDKLVCEAKPKSPNGFNWNKSLSIGFKIYSPKNINSKLHTSGGSITLRDLAGNLKFSTSGGSLSLAGLSGDIVGSTSGGSINVSDSRENIALSTSGGSITARNNSGTIKLSTSGGSIDLQNLRGDISASTSGGSVKVKAVNGSLHASTSGGSISLDEVSGNIKAGTSGGGINANVIAVDDYLELSTSSGSINVDMPLNTGLNMDVSANKINHPRLNNFDGDMSKSYMRGRLNGGGAKVRLHASSGSVNIN